MNMAFIATSIAKNTFRNLAWSLFSRRTNLGMDGIPTIKDETLRALQSLLAGTEAKVKGGRLLELGVGRTPDLMMAFMLCGAERVTGLDIDPWLGDDTLTRERLDEVASLLRGMEPGGFVEAFAASGQRADLEEVKAGISYARYDGSRIPLEAGSIDLIYSKSVMEHVRTRDVERLLASQFSVLRPGGHFCHIIDLRDHLHLKGDWEEDGDWLDALRYPEFLHDLMTDRRPAYINRIRARAWRRLIEDAGFEIVKWEPRQRPLSDDFRPEKLQPEFRDPSEDYSIAWVSVVARKP